MTILAATLLSGTTSKVPDNGLPANPHGPFGYHNPVRAEIMARTGNPDHHRWLHHIRPAAGCTQPIRLYGFTDTVEPSTGRLLSTIHTADLPDAVIYKPCRNRREAVCPSCSETYRRDAYQLIKAALVGGKGIPEVVATHPAVFPTFTAPSFGPVHTRHVTRHTCTNRRLCDCRPEPCHPRSGNPRCEHDRPIACFARHSGTDKELGRPLCLDCYDHDHQVVWNVMSGELWRRTRIAIERHLQRLARDRGLDLNRPGFSGGRVLPAAVVARG